jgi:hypothetical protein
MKRGDTLRGQGEVVNCVRTSPGYHTLTLKDAEVADVQQNSSG